MVHIPIDPFEQFYQQLSFFFTKPIPGAFIAYMKITDEIPHGLFSHTKLKTRPFHQVELTCEYLGVILRDLFQKTVAAAVLQLC